MPTSLLPQRMTAKRRADAGEDLLAALSDPKPWHPGRPCGVSVILDDVEPEIREKVQAIIEEIRAARRGGPPTNYNASWLARTLTSHGYSVTPLVIGGHIRGACRCARPD